MSHDRHFNRRRLIRSITLSAVALPLLAGCGGGTGSTLDAPASPVVTRGQIGPLALTLSTTKSVFQTGETVPFVFTVTNTSSETVNGSIDPVTSQPAATVTQGETRIWTKGGVPAGGATGVVPVSIRFGPGESRSYTFSWSQRSNDISGEGAQVPTGAYNVNAQYARLFLNEDESFEPTRGTVTPLQLTIR